MYLCGLFPFTMWLQCTLVALFLCTMYLYGPCFFCAMYLCGLCCFVQCHYNVHLWTSVSLYTVPLWPLFLCTMSLQCTFVNLGFFVHCTFVASVLCTMSLQCTFVACFFNNNNNNLIIIIIIIIMYIYHALINALSALIHINLNMIFYTHVKHSPTKTIDIKYYLKI